MKASLRTVLFILGACLVLTACGYHNPYVYTGPDRSIYVKDWSNRTSVLQLDAKIYQSLIKWFQKSGSLRITRAKEGADYILAGEIISIDLPSLTYNLTNTTSQVNLTLKVRYILKDLKTDAVLIEQPEEIWTEEYQISSNSTQTKDNENNALDVIIEELSQKIYQRSLLEFAKM